MMVQGKGEIIVNGVNHPVTHVLNVKQFTNNLLSMGQQQDKRLIVMIHNRMCKVYHHERGFSIETTMKVKRIFVVLGNIKEQK